MKKLMLLAAGIMMLSGCATVLEEGGGGLQIGSAGSAIGAPGVIVGQIMESAGKSERQRQAREKEFNEFPSPKWGVRHTVEASAGASAVLDKFFSKGLGSMSPQEKDFILYAKDFKKAAATQDFGLGDIESTNLEKQYRDPNRPWVKIDLKGPKGEAAKVLWCRAGREACIVALPGEEIAAE